MWNNNFKEIMEGPFYFPVNFYLILILWIFFSHWSKPQRTLAHFAPLPAFTRFNCGKRLFNGRHSLGWAFYSNWVPFFKKMEVNFLVPRSTKLEWWKHLQCSHAFFFYHHSKRTEFIFGLHPIFSADLTAEKVSKTITWLAFPRKSCIQPEKKYKPHGAN